MDHQKRGTLEKTKVEADFCKTSTITFLQTKFPGCVISESGDVVSVVGSYFIQNHYWITIKFGFFFSTSCFIQKVQIESSYNIYFWIWNKKIHFSFSFTPDQFYCCHESHYNLILFQVSCCLPHRPP